MSEFVLFFSVGVNFLPLIRAVAHRGFTPVVHSQIAQLLQQVGIPFQTVEAFIPPDIRAHVEAHSRRLVGELNKSLSSNAVRGAFSSPRGDFLSVTGEGFLKELLGLVANEIVVLEALEALTRRHHLSLIMMGCDNSPTERAVVEYAARQGIPTLQLAHAIYTRPLARIAAEHKLYSDSIAVYGTRAKEIMVEYGIEPERIFPTGSPTWDLFYTPEARLEKEEACRRLGLSPERPTVLYCSAYTDGSSAFYPALTRRLIVIHRALAEAARRLGEDAQIVVRPHPNELARAGLHKEAVAWLDGTYLRWMNDASIRQMHIVRSHKVESILASDVVVAVGSSSIIPEAMILQRPIVMAPWLEEEKLIYIEDDGVRVVHDEAELPGVIEDLLADPGGREEMVRRQSEVLPELNFGNDGRATERVAELAERLARRSPSVREAEPAPLRQPREIDGALSLLFAAHNFLPYGLGGTERYTRDIALEMRRRGHDVRVLYPRYVTDDPRQCSVREGQHEGLPVVEVLTSKNAFGLIRNEAIKPVLKSYLQEHPVDVVHAQHLMGLSVAFVEVLDELGIPFIFTANDFWFMCQQIHLVSPEGTVCAGPDTMDKCVQCMVRRMGNATEEQLPQLFHYMAERYFTQRRIMRGLELVLCPSRFLMEAFQRYEFLGANAVHVPQGANLFTPLERPERPVPPVKLAYIGTVDYRKGTDLAVDAFNRVETEGAELHIYGNVAHKEYFDKVMQSVLPGKTVAYHGEYTAEDLPGILASVDVALVPSRGENYPFVIREILNARVPVIASRVAGIPEIVKDGVNGLIFTGNDVGDLASKLEMVIKSPELIESLRAGIEPVKSIEQDVEEIEQHYLSLLARRKDHKPASLAQEAEVREAPKVSIVIPVFNRLDFTEKCLEAVDANTPAGIPFEVVVVDNGSSDGTTDFLKEAHEAGRLRAVFNSENLGFARACNQGAQTASGRYVLFLNNDTEVQPGWLEPLVKVLDEDPRVAAVGSKLLFPDGTIQHAGVIIAGVEGNTLLSPFNAFYTESGDEELSNLPQIYQAVTAACVLVRKSSFDAVKGFDEGYWNGFEDVDFCFKLGEHGWLVVYEPKSVVIHHEGKSGPERFSKEDENLERLNQLWVGKAKSDVIVEEDGNIIETDAKGVRVYSPHEEVSAEESGAPFASIIIVTYNSASTIRTCLDTVLSASEPSSEVIVVDNASSDETRSILARYEGRIKTILNDENEGFSRGCNQGILASSGDYVVLLNPDTAVTQGWVERMAAHFGPDVGAVGPVSNCVAAKQHVGRYMPGGRQGDFGLSQLAELLYEGNRGCTVETKLLIGFCVMLPRRVLDEIGLLDEGLFLGNDDLDISWRLGQAGYRLLIATDTFVYHEGQASFKSEEESKTSALVQESTDLLYKKLEAHYGEGNVPHPMELWDIDWFNPSRARFKAGSKDKEPPLTSIVMLTCNELNHTKLCLASIEAHTPWPHELIIVDNGSTDGTVEFLKEYMEVRPNVRVVANSTNRGFAAGNNQGLALAKGDFVLLLNNDTIVTPGWLERMLAVFARHEKAGVVGPVSNYVSGPQLVSEASYGNQAEMEAFAARWAEENSGRSEPIMRVVGFCLLARREIVERIGGLDERFGSGNFEDDDFCIRAALVGYEARIARDVFIHHAGSQTFKGAKIDYRQAMERNWGLFKAKWGIPADTPMEGAYHLPPELPEGAGQYIALPDLERGHRPEQGGRWWQEAAEGELEPRVLVGFLRDGPKLAEAVESIQRFNGTMKHPSVWADAGSINEQLGRSEYLVLMAPDVIVTKPWLDTMLAVAESDDSIAAVGPTSNAAPDPQRVKADYKGLKKALHKFSVRRFRQHKETWEEVTHLGGFCLLIRCQAVRHVGGLAENMPTSEGLWDLYGRLKAEGFRLACALGAYVHHMELTEDEGSRYDEKASDEEAASEVLGEGQAALERGDFESAAVLFEEATLQAPRLASAHWAHGSTLVALDRMSEGVEALRRAAELAPYEAALHNQLGVTLYQMGEAEEAVQVFETALEAAPGDVDVLLNLFELCRDQGRYGEAAEHLRQAQRFSPLDVDVLSALGAISLELRDLETAWKALQHLEAVEPGHPEIQPLRQALEAGSRIDSAP